MLKDEVNSKHRTLMEQVKKIPIELSKTKVYDCDYGIVVKGYGRLNHARGKRAFSAGFYFMETTILKSNLAAWQTKNHSSAGWHVYSSII
ncbi:MAG: hypothetical protein U1F76_30930 [Candidatus Competibacteraceae bacterium]